MNVPGGSDAFRRRRAGARPPTAAPPPDGPVPVAAPLPSAPGTAQRTSTIETHNNGHSEGLTNVGEIHLRIEGRDLRITMDMEVIGTVTPKNGVVTP